MRTWHAKSQRGDCRRHPRGHANVPSKHSQSQETHSPTCSTGRAGTHSGWHAAWGGGARYWGRGGGGEDMWGHRSAPLVLPAHDAPSEWAWGAHGSGESSRAELARAAARAAAYVKAGTTGVPRLGQVSAHGTCAAKTRHGGRWGGGGRGLGRWRGVDHARDCGARMCTAQHVPGSGQGVLDWRLAAAVAAP